MTLPKSIVSDCSLKWQGREQATLADGGRTLLDLYAAEVLWDGVPRVVLFFEHSFRHKGQPVTAGRKYVLRTDVMYRWQREPVG